MYVYNLASSFTGVRGFKGVTVGEAACEKDSVKELGFYHDGECKYVIGGRVGVKGEGLQ